MQIEDGLFVSIIGANGAGKSTLLKCLMHLLKPQTGSVLINQKDLANIDDVEIAKLRSSVLSDRVYPFNMTVSEIISLGRHPHQTLLGKINKKDKELIFEIIEILEIKSLFDKKFAELSDGQKQKVLIARAIVQEPKVLLLDEPATHLDAKSRIEILLKLREITKIKKIIVIASMHEIEIAYRISDKIVIIDQGNIKAENYPEEIFKNGTIQNIYNISKVVWHPVFGSLEIKSKKTQFPKIHVVGGFGTAIPAYRLLSRLGYSFSTGILDKIDVDYCLAKSIEAKIFSNSRPYETINLDEKILSDLSCVKIVIDTGFPINAKMTPNVKLIKKMSQRCIIFSIRNDLEDQQMFGVNNIKYGNLSDLEEFLNKMPELNK